MISQKGLPEISVRPEEGRFLQLLVRAVGARRAVEIGTLGGYSGTWIARGLAEGGQLLTIEKDSRHAEVARQCFALAGVAGRVEIKVGDAHDLLPGLRGPFDFVFVDAEKSGYPAYLEWAAGALRPGGMLAAHRAFRGGRLLDPNDRDPDNETLRAFNLRLARDPRWLATIYPGGDGMAVGVRL
ncbi:MAG: O-methyltransferase [Chloroflexi bacterium]|nr:O-methyltransferase [Chloroflexota bacterium]